MKRSSVLTYAQSSDIKSRTYLEYRNDMKKKAIAELEFLPYLQSVLAQKFDDKGLIVEKYGGDAKQWFGRSGKAITQAPDYSCRLSSGKTVYYEFQYATEIKKLKFFDFKVSKVGKKPPGKPRRPHTDREFFYVIKPDRKIAFLACEWIAENGEVGSVSAWRSRPAYRVPRELFMRQCEDGGPALERIIATVDTKNLLLEFQYAFLELESKNLSRLLQQVIDEERLMQIVPRTLAGFYRVCFLLDKLQKSPVAPGVWLVYLVSFFNINMDTLDFARFMYALDFLNFKCDDLMENEASALFAALESAEHYIERHFNNADLLLNDLNTPSIEVIRRLLFSANLLEDLRQDCIATWKMDFEPVDKIFQSVPNIALIASYIKRAANQT